MERDCIICKQKLQIGQIAPENYILCIECHDQKGYRVCRQDKKIYNIRDIKNDYVLDNPQTFIIGNYNLFEDINKRFVLYYDKQDICSNKCYNLLYIEECIGELNSILMFDSVCKDIVNKFLNTNELKEEFYKNKLLIKEKIKELEELKKNYL